MVSLSAKSSSVFARKPSGVMGLRCFVDQEGAVLKHHVRTRAFHFPALVRPMIIPHFTSQESIPDFFLLHTTLDCATSWRPQFARARDRRLLPVPELRKMLPIRVVLEPRSPASSATRATKALSV
jgi:hypothetical protein